MQDARKRERNFWWTVVGGLRRHAACKERFVALHPPWSLGEVGQSSPPKINRTAGRNQLQGLDVGARVSLWHLTVRVFRLRLDPSGKPPLLLGCWGAARLVPDCNMPFVMAIGESSEYWCDHRIAIKVLVTLVASLLTPVTHHHLGNATQSATLATHQSQELQQPVADHDPPPVNVHTY